jgi:hypothetical protein
MSDLFAPSTSLYECFRLYESNDGADVKWVAARSLSEVEALLQLNSFWCGWTKEVNPDDCFYSHPAPACMFFRFRRGYFGSPTAIILYSVKHGMFLPHQPLSNDHGVNLQGSPVPRHYDRAPSCHQR